MLPTLFYFFCCSPNFRLKIVDDDVDWQEMVKEEEVVEEDEDEAPVVRLLQTMSCAHSYMSTFGVCISHSYS